MQIQSGSLKKITIIVKGGMDVAYRMHFRELEPFEVSPAELLTDHLFRLRALAATRRIIRRPGDDVLDGLMKDADTSTIATQAEVEATKAVA